MRLEDEAPAEPWRLIERFRRRGQLGRAAPAQGAQPEPAPAAGSASEVTKPGQAEGTAAHRQPRHRFDGLALVDGGAGGAYHTPPTLSVVQLSGSTDGGSAGA